MQDLNTPNFFVFSVLEKMARGGAPKNETEVTDSEAWTDIPG